MPECYADLIVAGVGEVASRLYQRMPPPPLQQSSRRQAKRLAKACSTLAAENEAAVQDWPARYRPVFNRALTKTLKDEAARLTEWAEAFDLRHKDAVRPYRLTFFIAALNHVKDVTGTYHDQGFVQMLDALGVKGRDQDPESTEESRDFKSRAGEALR